MIPLDSRLSSVPGSELNGNWEAVDPKSSESDLKRFYLNVCHKVVQAGGAEGCPEGAAICSVGKKRDGKVGVTSLGIVNLSTTEHTRTTRRLPSTSY